MGPVAPAPAQIKSQLIKHLAPTGRAAKVRAILKTGGYHYSFKTVSGGRLAIGWYYLPSGAKINKPGHKRKLVLIATGASRFLRAGTIKFTIKLTRTGKQVLTTDRLMLTAKATYTPTGYSTTVATKVFTLR